jgi:hypothetical protein
VPLAGGAALQEFDAAAVGVVEEPAEVADALALRRPRRVNGELAVDAEAGDHLGEAVDAAVGGNAESWDTTSPYLVTHQSWYSRITNTTRRRKWFAVTNSGRMPSLNSWYTLAVNPPVEKSTAGTSHRTSEQVSSS